MRNVSAVRDILSGLLIILTSMYDVRNAVCVNDCKVSLVAGGFVINERCQVVTH